MGVWIARYLGPEQYGLLNFALAFVGLFGAIASLGLQGVMVRNIVNKPVDANSIMGTGFILRFLGGLASFSLIMIAIIIIRPEDLIAKLIVAILGFTLILQSSEVVKYWFESHVLSKYVVWVENSVFIVIAIIKVILILVHAPLMSFVFAVFAEALFVSLLLFTIYSWKAGRLKDWKPNFKIAKQLLNDSWPLILSGLAIAIYMRIDLVMLEYMIGNKSVGIYSAAVRISEVWYFIPMVIVSSVFPSIVEAKQKSEELYYQRLQKLYDLVLWIAIVVALLMTFLSNWVVELLFGFQYIEAGSVLKIHIWAGINVALGSAWSNWILIENKQKLVLYGHILGAVLNVVLNMFLIKSIGINGAALATLVSYWISALIIYALYKPGKSYRLFAKSLNIIRIINGIKRY